MEKTKGIDGAFASQSSTAHGIRWDQKGLTKREYFAAMAMQGMWSNPAVTKLAAELAAEKPATNSKDIIAIMAVDVADQLIEQLNKPGTNE